MTIFNDFVHGVADLGKDVSGAVVDPLPGVATYEAALDPNGTVLFDDLGTNVLYESSMAAGDVFRSMVGATLTVSRKQ